VEGREEQTESETAAASPRSFGPLFTTYRLRQNRITPAGSLPSSSASRSVSYLRAVFLPCGEPSLLLHVLHMQGPRGSRERSLGGLTHGHSWTKLISSFKT
jgi:hypothetical protein